MAKPDGGRAWLARVHHDLVKRLLWPARDRRDLGGAVVPGELRGALVDDEGSSIEAAALWARLAEEAPSALDDAAKDAFAAALGRCEAAAERDDLEGVLELTGAFERLTAVISRGAPAPRK